MQRFAPIALLVALVASFPATAQPAADLDSAELAAGLAQLNATLLEIKDLLAIQIDTQGLDLLLKRSELASTQAAELEGLLRSAESTRTGLEDQLRNLQSEQEMMEAQMRIGAREADTLAIEAYTRQIEARIDHARDRLRQAEGEVIDLQSRLDTKQRDLGDWQDLIDRRLSNI